ncbi:MAG: tRNA modification GTPase [Planctomycetales bacterium]|nr:tRNA modification GTPase [Planctomycetales bacterium]
MLLDTEDTIAAVASAAAGALRGIVRISGSDCLQCVERCFEPDNADAPVRIIKAPSLVSGRLLLPALATFLPATLYLWPGNRSYTRQPTAELHTVGSPPLLEAVLAEVCRHGARLARPGEFTLRAFLGGRLDLTQAEAVLGVIDARSEQQLKTALSQLAGGIAGPLGAVRGCLLDLLAHLEAGLDFVDEDIEFISREELLKELSIAAEQVEQIAGQLRSRGDANTVPRVVLCGLPNAGKSSLLNALAGEEAALVSSVAGTTRDFVSRRVCWHGVELELIDTAGIDDHTSDPIANESQITAQAQTENCDLRLRCVEAGTDSTSVILKAESLVPELEILTKCDVLDVVQSERSTFLRTSSRTGEGIAELRRRIAGLLSSQPGNSVASTAARCQESLSLAAEALRRAITTASEQAGEEFVAAEVRAALDDLGRVLGAVYTEDILDRIFSRFCIGK